MVKERLDTFLEAIEGNDEIVEEASWDSERFEEIAETLAEYADDDRFLTGIANDLAVLFEKYEPQFDKSRFLKSVGVKELT